MYSIIILTVLAIIVLYLGLARNTQRLVLPVSMVGLLASLVPMVMVWREPLMYFGDMLRDSHFSLAFSAVLVLATLLLFAMSGNYFTQISEHKAEYYALMLFSLCGGIIMVSFQNMTMLFLGIEILSVSVYILSGIKKKDLLSNEAALKYFLMGAFFTAVLLLGIAFVYGATGSFALGEIARSGHNGLANHYMLVSGMMLIFLALCFKLAIAPFHFWTPDVYEGAPTFVTAFMSTVVKVAGFAAFLRLFENAFPDLGEFYSGVTAVLVVLTLLLANITALRQESVKRMLSWSSISHAGYMLVPMILVARQHVSNGFMADNAVLIYSIAYCLASVAAFTVLISVQEETGREDFEAFRGLAARQPLQALAMTVALSSMAGIPLTAGFIGKFFIFKTAFESQQVWVVLAGVVSALIGIYYYFRLVSVMYFESALPLVSASSLSAVHPEDEPHSTYQPKAALQAVLVICTLVSVLLGIFPALFAGILN